MSQNNPLGPPPTSTPPILPAGSEGKLYTGPPPGLEHSMQPFEDAPSDDDNAAATISAATAVALAATVPAARPSAIPAPSAVVGGDGATVFDDAEEVPPRPTSAPPPRPPRPTPELPLTVSIVSDALKALDNLPKPHSWTLPTLKAPAKYLWPLSAPETSFKDPLNPASQETFPTFAALLAHLAYHPEASLIVHRAETIADPPAWTQAWTERIQAGHAASGSKSISDALLALGLPQVASSVFILAPSSLLPPTTIHAAERCPLTGGPLLGPDPWSMELALRASIQNARAVAASAQQLSERENLTWMGMCPLSGKEFSGAAGRAAVFEHLSSNYNARVGTPDNVIYASALLQLLASLIKEKTCWYCGGTFPDVRTLKAHMSKKGHYRIPPKDSNWDGFFLGSYLKEPSPVNVRQVLDSDESDDELVPDQGDDPKDWIAAPGDPDAVPPSVCLFCPWFDPQDDEGFLVIDHMKEKHGFHLAEQASSLDVYGLIKAINYTRSKIAECICPTCAKAFPNTDPAALLKHMKTECHAGLPPQETCADNAWLQPFLPEDTLLMQAPSLVPSMDDDWSDDDEDDEGFDGDDDAEGNDSGNVPSDGTPSKARKQLSPEMADWEKAREAAVDAALAGNIEALSSLPPPPKRKL